MEQREVKLRIELDVSAAAARADSLATAQPSNPGGPALPGAPAPDAGAGAGRSGADDAATAADGEGARSDGGGGRDRKRDRSVVEQAADVVEGRVAAKIERKVADEIRKSLGDRGVAGSTALGLASSAAGGGLSSRILSAIPFGNLAATAVDFGPALAAGVEKAIPGGEALAPIRRAAESAARGVATARSFLDAGGRAIEATSELAFGQARLTGRVNAEFLSRYAWERYSLEAQLMEAEKFRRLYGMERMGGAAGAVVQDLAARLAAGLGLSVGR